jgi:hypothetical protein
MASTNVRLGNCKEERRTWSERVFDDSRALLSFLFGLFITIGGVVSELSR